MKRTLPYITPDPAPARHGKQLTPIGVICVCTFIVGLFAGLLYSFLSDSRPIGSPVWAGPARRSR